MSKEKKVKQAILRPGSDGPSISVGGDEGSQISGLKYKIKRWSFPTVSKCPRCGSTDTVAVSTQKNIQYRVCRMAVCRNRFTVRGQKV